jgi:DNA-binding NarL/FixJ family response regulator
VLRIVIAEDSVLLREGLVQLLARFGHEVVAAAGDADELVGAVAEHHPEIAIVDVRMPPSYTDEGLRAALELRRGQPGLPVLVLSQYIAHAYAAQLLESSPDGGVGYLLKDRVGKVTEFVDAVEQVAAGGTVIDPEVVRQLLARRHDPLDRLTPREREVLGLMAQGRTNTAIARSLVVTDAAVHKHIGAIFAKLEIPTAGDDHRRVRAVLAYLHQTAPDRPGG